VKSAIANDGPRMKRIRPAPQGRAFRYQRRISHIELVLAERGNGEALANVPGGDAGGIGGAPVAKRRAPKRQSAKARREKQEEAGCEIKVSGACDRIRNDKFLKGLIRRSNGTKSPSLWFSPRLHQAVEVALVCGARLRQAAARRRQAEERAEGKAQVGGRELDRDRASGQQAADHYQDGASRESLSGARARRSTS
jgi:hypothetical protein